MREQELPYIGTVVFGRRELAFVGIGILYLGFVLSRIFFTGVSSSKVLGIVVSCTLILVAVIEASRRSAKNTSGEYRFDP